MPAFPLLADPGGYRACDWNLLADPAGRDYWLGFFGGPHGATMARAAAESGYGRAAIDGFLEDLQGFVLALRNDPRSFADRLDILLLDELRDDALRRHGIEDAFAETKRRENEAALTLLPQRLAGLAATPPERRAEELMRGVFAGNMFDMGAAATAKRYSDGAPPTYDDLHREVKPRPWFIDGAGAMTLHGRSRCVLFVDNAGGDVVLGMLPLALELAAGGAEVLLAANSRASLNDITAAELEALLPRVDAARPALASGALRIVSSGNAAPLIDLLHVSDEVAKASDGADLVVLEGMGRAIESNWTARFRCESWRLAVLKDPAVAAHRGGGLFDCVCRVEPT